MHPIYYYIAGYFALGALAIFLINKKHTETAPRQRWVKYFTYLIIVNIVVWSISGPAHGTSIAFFALSLLMVFMGVGELLYVGIMNFKGSKSLAIMGAGLAGFIGLSYGFLMLGAETNAGEIIFLYFLVFTFDGFSQIIGQLLGKIKITPRISPKKTLMGVVGGMVFCVLSAIAASSWIDISIPEAFSLGAIIGLACLAGDLLASVYKRAFGVKDYSKLIPMHGGILDRFDSLIFAGAVFYWVIPFIVQ